VRTKTLEKCSSIFWLHEDLKKFCGVDLVVAVKKTHERPFREKVLGRALDCVKSNPNLVWMFLSENVDAFVRTEEENNSSDVTVSVAAATVVVAMVAVAGSKRKR
jgi:hypothetical protein